MTQVAKRLFASQFVSGMLHYDDFYAELNDMFARFVIRFKIEGRHSPVKAIVDTGAQWCVFDPVLLHQNELDMSLDDDTNVYRLMVRGTIYEGQLIRVGITLEAEYGDDLDVDATVFVPTLDPDDVWPWPNFLGLEGLLNRIRRAIDPTENAFYFGPV